MLGRSIFVGERYERNLKIISVMSVIISIAGFIMFVMNIAAEEYVVSLTSVAFLLTGIGCFFCTAVSKHRRVAMALSIFTVVTVMTYYVVSVSNGFAFLWTILVPLAISYLFSVRAGIIISFYFTVLFAVVFYTPLRSLVEGHYSAIVLIRFPILYFFLFITTSFVMIQYHKSVLDQIDYAEQLQKAKEAADRANKAKSDFLAEMSHEIRTPINAVLGMNEMIQRESAWAQEDIPPEEKEESFRKISTYADDLEDAGNNLLSIINDILDFSKIEAGKLELVENNYELSILISDVSNMISFRVREKGLEYHLDVDERIPELLYGDKVRVRQIITNLLTNAFKYTNQGSIRLIIRAEEQSFRPGGIVTLVITVQDTGIGIHKEDIPKLFTKFQRVDLERNSTIEGTGMGLAITNRLLEMMGGSISVESEYGKGSSFTVRVPQRIVSCEPLGNVRSADPAGGRTGHTHKGIFKAPEARILVVDDTRMNLAVTVGLLQRTGIQIDTALSGQDALELLAAKPFDLVLMDQRMPGMDGVETLHRLRETKGSLNAETPVICMTADAIIGAKERYTAAGFTDYIPKPVTGEVLERTIVRHLPAGKVTMLRNSDGQEEAAETRALAERFAPLREGGIDPETGLNYCQRDEALYVSLLQEYVRSSEDYMQSMQTGLEAQDWKTFGIAAHTVKSTSRMIGAEELAGIAAGLEKAANEEDAAFIREGYPGLAESYRKAVETVRRTTGDTGEPAEPDEDIMEFEPEE